MRFPLLSDNNNHSHCTWLLWACLDSGVQSALSKYQGRTHRRRLTIPENDGQAVVKTVYLEDTEKIAEIMETVESENHMRRIN